MKYSTRKHNNNLTQINTNTQKRNLLIENTAQNDGSSIRIGIESVAGYKDAYTTIKDIRKGSHSVQKVNVSTDKVIRAGEMEPVFEAGNVHFRKTWWNQPVLEQLAQFPAGTHDDFVDSITGAASFWLEIQTSRALFWRNVIIIYFG